MPERWTWFPAALPSASPLVMETDDDAAVRLLWFDGTGPLTATGITSKGPSQEGETAFDVLVPSRLIVTQVLLDADSLPSLWTERGTISRSLVNIPVRFGESMALGRLLIERDGFEDREIFCFPRSAPIEWIRAPHKGMLDAEFHCPYPYFQETTDTESDEIEVDSSVTVVNDGDVDAPFIARIFGPATEVTLTNLSSGEVLTVTVSLADSTEWLEVDTTPGVKTVRKYTDEDTWTNAISGLSLADGRLWLLRPGNNSVKLEAVGDDANTVATLTYRPRYAGL